VKMHADQVDVSVDVVAALVAAQFPRWRGLPVRPIVSHGTVNALFRLGDDVVLRFPLRPSLDPEMRESLGYEQDVARRVAAHLPVAVPEPLAIGEPGDGYAGPWTAYRWIAGDPATSARVDDPDRLARDLAGFVQAFHAIDTGGGGWDGCSRGGPLATRDRSVRRALAESGHLTDTTRLAAVWERCLAAAEHRGPDVWIHADLVPGNLLVRDGRLTAVLDLEAACLGDPAVDLMPAWNLFSAGARQVYRDALGVDDATWERGRGWAIVQAIPALPYYIQTNPVMAANARLTLQAVLT
jgi:aminoglycoside phosphotransferase (APT) family kinase protein